MNHFIERATCAFASMLRDAMGVLSRHQRYRIHRDGGSCVLYSGLAIETQSVVVPSCSQYLKRGVGWA